jgi:hypothetical protein
MYKILSLINTIQYRNVVIPALGRHLLLKIDGVLRNDRLKYLNTLIIIPRCSGGLWVMKKLLLCINQPKVKCLIKKVR